MQGGQDDYNRKDTRTNRNNKHRTSHTRLYTKLWSFHITPPPITGKFIKNLSQADVFSLSIPFIISCTEQ